MIADIRLSREIKEPLYLQIRNQIRNLILSGDLPVGTRLPPERSLAGSLGVNRTTVSTAYNELAADGLVEGRVGLGTVVCPLPSAARSAGDDFLPQSLSWQEFFHATGEQAREPLIRELMALCAQENVISLAGGVPAPDLYPVERFASAVDKVLRQHGQALLQYCPTEGHLAFRETLTDLAAKRGITTSPANILVLAGSQQGLDLIARALISPGDLVIIGVPSYLGAIQIFRAAGARLVGVPVDQNGIRTDVLERVLTRYRPQLIYTLPTFQNPSGAVMDSERRQALLSLAQRYQIPILEDDPYGELYFDAPPPSPIKSFDSHGHVMYLSTFSKMLFPGIRIGWMVAPRPVIDHLASFKQHADLHSNTLAQWALGDFIQQGWLDEHLLVLREAYPRRYQSMMAALRKHVPWGLRWNEPKGGIYLWCHLQAGLHSRDLLAEAVKHRVAFVSGEAFHADGGGQDAFRLNFTHQDRQGIQEGIRRLGKALRSVVETRQGRQVAQQEALRPIV